MLPAFRKRIVTSAMLLCALAALASFQPAQAASGEHCFTETGFCISGSIRAYWERNGGLAVFGYPVTAQRTEIVEQSWEGPVQWFERDRLEDHSADGQGVLAGRLGDSALQIQGINWRTLPGDSSAIAGCRFFRETQFNLCEPFLSYWKQNGGLERFGYPLTRARQETLEGREYTVQYFERRRMEAHPENIGTPYVVLLGLLGRDVFAVEGDNNVVQLDPGDMRGYIQQPILDAAWAKLKPGYPKAALMIGLVDVVGDYAWALAQPQGQPQIHVYLKAQSGAWKVIASEVYPMPEPLRKLGVPESLMGYNDGFAVTVAALEQTQDPRGGGLSGYITRPRVEGDYARFWLVPTLAENLDSVTTFYKRERGTWKFLTAGSAFPEDNLRDLGIPQALWSYGDSVRGPAK